MQNRIYNIAGINILISGEIHPNLLQSIQMRMGSFACSNTIKPHIYINIVDSWKDCIPSGELLFEQRNEQKNRNESSWEVNNGYLFYYQHDVADRSFYITVSKDFSQCKLCFRYHRNRVIEFETAVRMIFHLYAQYKNTLLFHASCIIKDGKAILFHAKSGTGKSTHSQQWMKVFPDAELLNDDGPIVRVWPDGRVIAYGSPWSGKTPCYKNMSVPVAAFVRINRANENKIHRLSPVQAYASLLPSCTSQMKWNKEIADAQHETLTKIISSVPCYQLDCLPNEDAARVCAAEVLK